MQASRDRPSETDAELIDALVTKLREVPFLTIEQIRTNDRVAEREIDVAVDLRLREGPQVRLVGGIMRTGEPRIARGAADRLFYLTRRTMPGAYGVFLAPYISDESAAICEANGFGYLDLAGNCLLSFGTVYIRTEGRPNARPQKRLLRTMYSPKAERVLRVLLTDPKKVWRLQELADASAVSLGQAHNLKKLLHDREWLTTGVNGLQLGQPGRLLEEWTNNYDFKRSVQHGFHSLQDISAIEATIADVGSREHIQYAFTGFSGGARVAPYARYQRVHAYVEPQRLPVLAELAGLRSVSSGANVILIEPYDEGVFYGSQDREGRIVSPVQLYLDLRALPGRAEDAAEFLRDTVLREQW